MVDNIFRTTVFRAAISLERGKFALYSVEAMMPSSLPFMLSLFVSVCVSVFVCVSVLVCVIAYVCVSVFECFSDIFLRTNIAASVRCS